MSISAIMDAVGQKYATVDWTSLNKMDEIMTTPLDNVMNLDKHLARLTRHINMSVAAGFNVEEHRRVKFFRQSVQHHHQIAETLKSFDRDHPNPKSHTYALIIAHVRVQLPPILSAAGTNVAAKTAFHAEPTMSHADLLTAYAALMEQHTKGVAASKRQLQKQQEQQRANKRRRGEGREPTAIKDAVDPDRPCEFYCYTHGKQNSHASPQCKVMLNDKANFTDAMRKAKTPRDVPGGSTSVKGKTGPPVQARGYMVTGSSMEESPSTTPVEAYDGEYCPQGRQFPPEAEFETRRPTDKHSMAQV